MATNDRQDREFISHLISGTLLEEAIEWIRKNLSPEDVFSEGDLRDWARDMGYTQED